MSEKPADLVPFTAAGLGVPVSKVDLSGASLAAAVTDAATDVHLRWVAGWLASYPSLHTRKAYWGDLVDFVTWTTNQQRTVLELTKTDLGAYKALLEDGDPASGRRAYAKSSVARKLAAISSFFEHLITEDHLDTNPLTRIRRPTTSNDDTTTQALSKEEAIDLLATAEAHGPRDHALVCLMLLNGLRVSSVCDATVEDLTETDGHLVLAIRAKGNQRRNAPLAPRTWRAIADHVGERRDGPLVLANDAGPLNRRAAARIVTRLTRRAGISKSISPHSLRHSFVTLARAAGVDLRDVQQAAGHADPRTTMTYDRTVERLDAHPTYAITGLLTT